MFQQVTEVFGLEGLIGGTPKACLFQFAFCLLLYNMIQVMRAYVAEAQQREIEEISSEKLFDDVKRELIAWNVMLDVESTTHYFARLPNIETLRARLKNWRERRGARLGEIPETQEPATATRDHQETGT